jgi:hypothetical protein
MSPSTAECQPLCLGKTLKQPMLLGILTHYGLRQQIVLDTIPCM